MKSIVILGGGSGGVVCANELRKKLNGDHKITLIDKNESHIFYPSLLWVIFGRRKPHDIMRPLNTLSKKGITFIKGEVKDISIQKNRISVDGQDINYDYLIISLGADLNTGIMPESENIFNFYSLDGAERAKNAIENFTSGKIVILISGMPYKCPAAPYELALLLNSYFKKKKIRDKVEIEIYTPEPLPMPTAGPKLGNMFKRMIEAKGIKLNTEHKVKIITKEKILFENNKEVGFNLLFVVPPHQAPQVVKNTGLTNETGWIPVNGETLKTQFENVYAIGDITSIKLPGQYEAGKNLFLPKAGVFAHYQAEVVAENIANEINGKTPDKKFHGKGYCVLELGSNLATFVRGTFYNLPHPNVNMLPPLPLWHWGRILFEKWWLRKWF